LKRECDALMQINDCGESERRGEGDAQETRRRAARY
jgi:hypothetical protein